MNVHTESVWVDNEGQTDKEIICISKKGQELQFEYEIGNLRIDFIKLKKIMEFLSDPEIDYDK
jgi:hypothetical protein